jgi:hypothetical protein
LYSYGKAAWAVGAVNNAAANRIAEMHPCLTKPPAGHCLALRVGVRRFAHEKAPREARGFLFRRAVGVER